MTDILRITTRLREIAGDHPNEAEAYRLIADALDELDPGLNMGPDTNVDDLANDVRELEQRLDALEQA